MRYNCALTQFTYVLMQFSPKREHRPFPVVNKVQFSASVFEDPDELIFVAHNSSIEDGESSDKILSWRAVIKRVT